MAETTDKEQAPPTDVQKLETQLQHWQAKATDLEKRIGGLDIERTKAELQALRDANSELMRERANKGGEKERDDWEAHIKGEYDKRYGQKFSELENTNNSLSSEIKKLKVTNVGVEKAARLGFLPKALPLIERVINEKCDLLNGEIVIKGDDGKPMPSQTDPRQNMTVDEFLKGYAEENDFLVSSTVVSGTKHPGERARGNGEISHPAGFDSWPQSERRAWFDRNKGANRLLKGYV